MRRLAARLGFYAVRNKSVNTPLVARYRTIVISNIELILIQNDLQNTAYDKFANISISTL